MEFVGVVYLPKLPMQQQPCCLVNKGTVSKSTVNNLTNYDETMLCDMVQP
jgi:hypothetical protein